MDQEEKQTGNSSGTTDEATGTIDTPQETTPEMPKGEKSTGAIIGTIIIVVLLVIGGLYFLSQRTDKIPATPEEILAEPDTATEVLEAQGTSDELADIEADAESTDFGELDMELDDIEAELSL